MDAQGPIEQLIAVFAKLPGLGPRSARRIVLKLIRERARLLEPLHRQIDAVLDQATICKVCSNIDTSDPCHICLDTRRDDGVICVVEDVADLWAIERSHMHRGRYHVLGGTLSAMDGRGPQQLGIDKLMYRVEGGAREVILATNNTVEGQTTAHYITEALEPLKVKVTRLAQGIPVGGELDYLDEGTLGAAFTSRLPI
jgi:recombination protein RecR